MRITRRDYLRASTAASVALGLKASGLVGMTEAFAATTRPPVLWLQAQSCTGCSVSFLNSIYYATVDQLLTQTLDVKYHSNIMAATDDLAISAANAAYTKGGYILVVEGAVPMGANGKYCELWPGLTALSGVRQFASKASHVIAVGTCAAFGGIAAGNPNPTVAKSVKYVLGSRPVVNIPGCPTHPDWVVGTVAYILQNGKAPALDSLYRPLTYFSTTVHERCPRRGTDDDGGLGGSTCMREAGCKGPETKADCPIRKWNSPGASKTGVNWCIGASFPCHGCTEPKFPNTFVPFIRAEGDDD